MYGGIFEKNGQHTVGPRYAVFFIGKRRVSFDKAAFSADTQIRLCAFLRVKAGVGDCEGRWNLSAFLTDDRACRDDRNGKYCWCGDGDGAWRARSAALDDAGGACGTVNQICGKYAFGCLPPQG